MRPDMLGNQGAQCVEREVVRMCFAWRRSCAEGMRPSAKWAGIKVRDAPAAESVQLLGSAAAEVMPKEPGAVLVEYLPADAARVPWPRMWSFIAGHPGERYGRVTVRECAPSKEEQNTIKAKYNTFLVAQANPRARESKMS